MAEKSFRDLFPDFPNGPLTPYRDQASFDWRRMKLAVENEDLIRLKYAMWDEFRNNELFHPPQKEMSMSDYRHIIWKRMKFMKSKDFMSLPKIFENPKALATMNEAMFSYDIESSMKLGLNYSMFSNTIQSLGTEKHHKYISQTLDGEIRGCFALTEISHGSNAKGMKTTATYDVKTKEFILHSADFTAAKCWVGNLGQCATHAVVYAKLITADGKDHGLHAFVVPVRCTRTLRAFPGVIVGDIGEKIALNGVDNGFVMFNHYRISADTLLNKLGGVDENGNYVSEFRDPNKRFGASLGALSGGRVQICGMATCNIQKAIAIAVRYSAVRKQFGPENSTEEYSVIEYQQQQFRLLPYLAASFACRIFSNWFSEVYTTFLVDNFAGANKGDMGAFKGMELHALSSGAKPTIAWIVRDGVQVCREACGGHGYLQAAGLGKIRNENDANCTYEGENSLLIQQTSNWLMTQWQNMGKGEKLVAPYDTANYLNDHVQILKKKGQISSQAEATNPKFLLDSYKWLVCYMLKLTGDKAGDLKSQGIDSFTVKNNTQSYHAATLSVVFVEHALLNIFNNHALQVEDKNCRDVMLRMVSLFGAWLLEKHLGTLYMGGYFSKNEGQYLRDGVVDLCRLLKPDCIALVDVIAPPDFILNSVLGNSDGKVYEHLQNSFFSYPGSLSRPDWWKDVVKWKDSKL